MTLVLVQSKNLELTPTIEAAAQKAGQKLFRLDKKLSRVEFYLEFAGTTGHDQTISKLKLLRNGGKDLFVESKDVDLYESIKESAKQAHDALLREKSRTLDKSHR